MRHASPLRSSHFYPRPPRGGRPKGAVASTTTPKIFLSTPSARRATTATTSPSPAARFLSTPSARRATSGIGCTSGSSAISIHALREEGDVLQAGDDDRALGISIHALREEGDWRGVAQAVEDSQFLSTPSARRATTSPRKCGPAASYFYPRPPRGGRPRSSALNLSDMLFLSTPSARRATNRYRAERKGERYFYPRPPRGGRPRE